VVIRYPRGSSPDVACTELDVPVVPGKAAVIRKSPGDRAVIWSIGRELFTALACADILAGAGIAVTVVDARFLKPFDRALALELAMLPHFTIEDHCMVGGLFSALNEALSGVQHGVVRGFGWSEDELTGHGEISKLRARAGMTPKQIAGVISGALGETL
jgi:1-deoxy-D-xylulose-5-phosphate synthase